MSSENRSGRGRNGRGYRGGRGRGRFRGGDNKARSPISKQLEMKLFLHGIGRDKQTVTYNTVKDHIVQYVQKTYDNGQDIAISLRDLFKKDLSTLAPIRGQATATDPAVRANEQAGMDILYQAELERYLDRTDTLEQNLTKAYSLIYSTYCNKMMQNRIEEHPDYETTIRDDPIELLTKIKVLMHDPIRAKYPFASLTEAMIRMLNIKQQENEQLLDYIKRFKQFRDITKSHVGTDILDTFVENTREYRDESDAAAKKAMKVGAFNKWMSYLLLRNSDPNKYGSMINGLISQFSMGNNQYPRTITAATDILSNHRHDNWGTSNKKTNWSNKPKEDENNTPKSQNETNETSVAQQNNKDKTCYCCGKKGHISPECKEKNTRKKEDWAFRKAEQHMQAQADTARTDDESTLEIESVQSVRSLRVGWNGLLIGLNTQDIKKQSLYNAHDLELRLKNCITLDNGSTLSLFSNPDLVQDI
jgi:hypothetical protein